MGTNTPGSTMLGRNIALAGSVLEKKERLFGVAKQDTA